MTQYRPSRQCNIECQYLGEGCLEVDPKFSESTVPKILSEIDRAVGSCYCSFYISFWPKPDLDSNVYGCSYMLQYYDMYYI